VCECEAFTFVVRCVLCVLCAICGELVGKIKFRYSVAVWKFSRRRCLPFVSSCWNCVWQSARSTRYRCRCRCRCVCKLQANNPSHTTAPQHHSTTSAAALTHSLLPSPSPSPSLLSLRHIQQILLRVLLNSFSIQFSHVLLRVQTRYFRFRQQQTKKSNQQQNNKKREPNQTFELLHILTLITRWIKLLKH